MGDKGTGKHTVMKRFCGVPLDTPNEDEMVCASARTEINHEKKHKVTEVRQHRLHLASRTFGILSRC